jgi:nicotinate-nucleotide adenylyltransferase
VGLVKVGVLGGTFDPPHKGHLAIALDARKSLGLSRVIFIPAGQPWLKAGAPVSPAEDRYEMVRLAIAGHPHLAISRIEVDRPGPSYTVDTLEALKSELGSETELYFIIGWDALTQLPQWREAARIVRLARLVAVPRPGYSRPDLKAIEKQIPGISARVDFLDMAMVEVSATEIRQRVSAGLPISGLVPEAVEKYVTERGLFRS